LTNKLSWTILYKYISFVRETAYVELAGGRFDISNLCLHDRIFY